MLGDNYDPFGQGNEAENQNINQFIENKTKFL